MAEHPALGFTPPHHQTSAKIGANDAKIPGRMYSRTIHPEIFRR